MRCVSVELGNVYNWARHVRTRKHILGGGGGKVDDDMGGGGGKVDDDVGARGG